MATVTDKYQVGASSTPSQNFVLKTGNDGTFTLARGNIGAETDVIKVLADGSTTINGNSVGKYYETLITGWVAGADVVLTHGLGVVPKFAIFEAVAKTTVDKLAVGEAEEIVMWTSTSSSYNCIARKKTLTQVTVGIGASGVSTCNNSNIHTARTNTQVDIRVRLFG